MSRGCVRIIFMKILVTGGAGFIGSNINRFLLEEGHQVTVLDNLSTGNEDSIDKRVAFFKEDLSNQKRLEEILNSQDIVIHLANSALVTESIQKPVEYIENNIVGTAKLLEAMRKTGVKKMIFSSSCTVYGTPSELPLTEESPIGEVQNPYGLTKVAAEQLCTLYHSLYGLDITILRYFNPYGPGELHKVETHAIPNFIKAALSKKPIPLYWKGEQVRDFIYIDDLAAAHVLPLNLSGLHIYNVGTETGVEVIDVVKKIFEILRYEVEIEDKGERKGDVPQLVASAEKIKKELGWSAKIPLEEGLKRTIDFFKQHFKSY